MYLSKKLLAAYLLVVMSNFIHAEPPAPEGQPTAITSSSAGQQASSSDQSTAKPSLGLMYSMARDEEESSQRAHCLCAAASYYAGNK